MRRWLAGLLGAISALNGVDMLFDGPAWYQCTPGVVFTGPYNAHFVQDIGAAFLAAGLGLIARAWRVRYWPAAVAGASFMALHAAIHATMLLGMTFGHHEDRAPVTDVALIASAALALFVAFPAKGEQ